MIPCCSVSASGRSCNCTKDVYQITDERGDLVGSVPAYNEIEAKMGMARMQGLKNSHGWTDYPSSWLAERKEENV